MEQQSGPGDKVHQQQSQHHFQHPFQETNTTNQTKRIQRNTTAFRHTSCQNRPNTACRRFRWGRDSCHNPSSCIQTRCHNSLNSPHLPSAGSWTWSAANHTSLTPQREIPPPPPLAFLALQPRPAKCSGYSYFGGIQVSSFMQ